MTPNIERAQRKGHFQFTADKHVNWYSHLWRAIWQYLLKCQTLWPSSFISSPIYKNIHYSVQVYIYTALFIVTKIQHNLYTHVGTSQLISVIQNPLAKQKGGVLSLSWKVPWRRKWQPSPVFLPGHLVDYSPESQNAGHNLALNNKCPNREREMVVYYKS